MLNFSEDEALLYFYLEIRDYWGIFRDIEVKFIWFQVWTVKERMLGGNSVGQRVIFYLFEELTWSSTQS